MASIGHLLFGLAVARAHDRHAQAAVPHRSVRERATAALAFSALALVPDLDVIAFPLGIPYGAELGHRGAAHSLLVGVVVGVAAALVLARELRAALVPTALAAVAAVTSHGLLDALTDGGLGIALCWPWSNERLFAPVQPIPVAPIGAAFLSARGLHVAAVELLLFSPCALYAIFGGRGVAARLVGRLRAAPGATRARAPDR